MKLRQSTSNLIDANRRIGVLMPIASLPSRYGVGDFGAKAYEFIDIMKSMGLNLWQVLPITPLGYGNSPYQGYSSFAGDEIYISLDLLVNDGLLLPSELKALNARSAKIDYERSRGHKSKILKKAFNRFKQQRNLLGQYKEFVKSHSSWLMNYAVFMALKNINSNKCWHEWPINHKNWIKNKQLDLTPYQSEIDYAMFLQFIFFKQWFDLKHYANKNDILIMGDIPIYLGFDSLDVWQNQELFLLDKRQNPSFVAGVPPDFFAKDGQRWGNPLYDWDAIAQDDFKFWINRLSASAKIFDIIRIDHFRAFDTYWKIKASCKTAREGQWVEAPGYALFDNVYKKLPNIKIIAEDLGDLRPQVLKLRDHYNLPGMKVFQFLFNAKGDNSELVDTANSVIYTGTHDNTTLIGWYNSLKATARRDILAYFKINSDEMYVEKKLRKATLKYLLSSRAKYVIFPLQDILGLSDNARINTPGTIGSPNWEWRLTSYTILYKQVEFINKLFNNLQ